MIRAPDDVGMTPLTLATLVGATGAVTTLCKYCVKADESDQAKRTPLILGAILGDVECLKAVLKLKPDINAMDIHVRKNSSLFNF